MAVCVDPRALRDKKKRFYIRYLRGLGHRIKVEVLGTKDKYYLIRIVTDRPTSRILRKYGISIGSCSEALVSSSILGELLYQQREGKIIGEAREGYPIIVSTDRRIAVTTPELAGCLMSDSILWVDLKGLGRPEGFEELEGIPLPRRPQKFFELVGSLGRILNTDASAISSALKREELLSDEEIDFVVPQPILELERWAVFTRDHAECSRCYVDLSGIPQNFGPIIEVLLAHQDMLPIVVIPKRWEHSLRRLPRGVFIVDEPEESLYDTVIYGDYVVRMVNFNGKKIFFREGLA